MLLHNYDFYDIYSILIGIRFKPKEEYNAQIIQNVINVLSLPQTDNVIESNIIRKQIRQIEGIDRELFGFAYVDNLYTYGLKIIEDDYPYLFLTKALEKLLECILNHDDQQVYDLADALHNVPILFADGCKNYCKAIKTEFSEYNRTYKTDIPRRLFNKSDKSLRIHGVKREFDSLGFCLKKHYCPYCSEKLIRTKTETIVNSGSEEASNYDFSNGDGFMTGNIKFVRTVYLCKKCGREYTEKEVKENDLIAELQKK